MARLLDSNYKPVHAGVWRLWKVEGDTAWPDRQVSDTGGFQIPSSGLWVVEAWPDSIASGSMTGLSKAKFVDTSCSRFLTHLEGLAPNQFGVLPCRDLPSPSQASRPAKRPLGVGVFGALDTSHKVVPVPGGSASTRFLIWKVRWDTIKKPMPSPPAPVAGRDSVLLHLGSRQWSAIRGSFDLALPSGDWYVEGWNAAIDDTLSRYDWAYPPATRWVDSTILDTCFRSPSARLGANCPASIAPSPWHKEADAHFTVHVP